MRIAASVRPRKGPGQAGAENEAATGKVDRDLRWWRDKLTKNSEGMFGASVTRWALHLLLAFEGKRGSRITAPHMRGLAERFEVPAKFISRALAVLMRTGLVTEECSQPVRLAFHRELLPRRKNLAQVVRGRISTRARAWLLDAEGYRCARCERERPWPAGNLVIDHIVPVSLRGVDEPANWVALCRAHNRAKWHWFDPDYIRRYHGERVRRRVQVRFHHGFFWPVINGRLRTETRDAVNTMQPPGAAR